MSPPACGIWHRTDDRFFTVRGNEDAGVDLSRYDTRKQPKKADAPITLEDDKCSRLSIYLQSRTARSGR
jgi:hypothetical protein